MKHLLKYLATPATFVAAFILFGAPSAPGVAAVEVVANVSTGVGGEAYALCGGELHGYGTSGLGLRRQPRLRRSLSIRQQRCVPRSTPPPPR